MSSLSVKQKALIFLNKYKAYDKSDIYNTPWELTQDGISGAICISRAHASIVLNQLKNEDKVEEKITHIRNGKIKRKSYYLTPLGMEEAAKVLEFAAKEKIDVSDILDSKKHGSGIDPDKLNKGDRFALGCACAFNMAIDPSALPPVTNITLPTDISGKVTFDEDYRKRVLESANEDERAEWHGYAANYWFDKKVKRAEDFYECLKELLYQYVESGRNRDACKLISGEAYYFINSIDDELHDIIGKIKPVGKYEKDILMLSIEICLEYDEMDETDALVKRLSELDSDCASIYVFDIEMKKGDRDAAKAAIEDNWKTYPMAGIRWASLLREEGRYKEARELLESIKGIYDTEYDNFQVEKFIELARIDSAEGRYDDAYQRLSKVRASFNNAVFNKRLNALEKELKAKLSI